MKLAPIALFVYNRPWHTEKALLALEKNGLAAESDLIIYSDAAKSQEQERAVSQVRKTVQAAKGFKRVEIIKHRENRGIAGSIISGVSEVIDRRGRVIVLEDDLVSSPYFLQYMNKALDFYENEERVISIHGYFYPIQADLPETFFLRGADCWGWATWRRGWDQFERDGRKLLAELRERKLSKAFDYDGAYGYTKMLKDQVRGKIDSWAVRWHASAFLRERLTLYPARSLIRNNALDSGGVHCRNLKRLDTEPAVRPVHVGRIPVRENMEVRERVKGFLRSMRPSLLERCKSWIT